MPTFYVAIFKGELLIPTEPPKDEVGIVPITWFTDPIEGEKQKVRWPKPGIGSVKLTRMIKNCVKPGDDWQTLDYERIVSHAETYEEAEQKAEIAEMHSDVDTKWAELNDKKKRSGRHKKKVTSSESDCDDDSDESRPSPPKLLASELRNMVVPSSLKKTVKSEKMNSMSKMIGRRVEQQEQQPLDRSASSDPPNFEASKDNGKIRVSTSSVDSGTGDDNWVNEESNNFATENNGPEESNGNVKESCQKILHSFSGTSHDELSGAARQSDETEASRKKKPSILSEETLTYTQGYVIGINLPGGSHETPKTVGELLALSLDDRFVHSYALQLHNMRESVHTRRIVQDLAKYLEDLTLSGNSSQDRLDSLGSCFPFNNKGDLIAFDTKIKEDRSMRKDVKKYLKQYAGNDGHKTVRSVMERIMTDRVAIKLNMKGRGNKKTGFDGMELYKIVCEIAYEMQNSFVEGIANKFVAGYLKQTKHRSKGQIESGEASP